MQLLVKFRIKGVGKPTDRPIEWLIEADSTADKRVKTLITQDHRFADKSSEARFKVTIVSTRPYEPEELEG